MNHLDNAMPAFLILIIFFISILAGVGSLVNGESEVVADEVVADEVVTNEVIADEVIADEVVADEIVGEQINEVVNVSYDGIIEAQLKALEFILDFGVYCNVRDLEEEYDFESLTAFNELCELMIYIYPDEKDIQKFYEEYNKINVEFFSKFDYTSFVLADFYLLEIEDMLEFTDVYERIDGKINSFKTDVDANVEVLFGEQFIRVSELVESIMDLEKKVEIEAKNPCIAVIKVEDIFETRYFLFTATTTDYAVPLLFDLFILEPMPEDYSRKREIAWQAKKDFDSSIKKDEIEMFSEEYKERYLEMVGAFEDAFACWQKYYN